MIRRAVAARPSPRILLPGWPSRNARQTRSPGLHRPGDHRRLQVRAGRDADRRRARRARPDALGRLRLRTGLARSPRARQRPALCRRCGDKSATLVQRRHSAPLRRARRGRVRLRERVSRRRDRPVAGKEVGRVSHDRRHGVAAPIRDRGRVQQADRRASGGTGREFARDRLSRMGAARPESPGEEQGVRGPGVRSSVTSGVRRSGGPAVRNDLGKRLPEVVRVSRTSGRPDPRTSVFNEE